MSQALHIIIDRGISAPEHVRYVVDVINDTEKRFVFYLMSTVKPSWKSNVLYTNDDAHINT